MSRQDDDFEVRLGRIGDRKAGQTTPYIKRVLRDSEKAIGRGRPGGRQRRFNGSRIGRGGATGTLAANGRSVHGARRVIVKTRVVRMKSGDLGAAKAHLRYVQRDGVTREGKPGRFYDATSEGADGIAFLERNSGDRHQFRFIVSAEDGGELTDLKPFIRDLMRRMEQDLGTELDWIAVDHFNTGQPHTHVVLRGKDERGADLVIARDYIAFGMRSRASELLTRELGPETALETIRKLEREVVQERFTRLDRTILRDAANGALRVGANPERSPQRHALRMGRLRTLERLGLAAEAEPGLWQVSPQLEPTLRRMGERSDIVKTMHRQLQVARLERPTAEYAIFDPGEPGARAVGRVLAEGFSDELQERRYVIAEGVDGRTHYAEIGVRGPDDEPLAAGMIVEFRGRGTGPRPADRTIAEIAAQNHGVYSAELHRTLDRRASDEYIATHVRRLEALRRDGHVERGKDGNWRVGTDYVDRATRYEAAKRSQVPAQVRVLSWQALEKLPGAQGATWLDRQLLGRETELLRPSGFGATVEGALDQRRRWLAAEGLAKETHGRLVYARNLIETLQRRELVKTGTEIAHATGLGYFEPKKGDELQGVYRRAVNLSSGRFALIERAHDFTLVPWRPVLERAKGKAVTGIVRGEGISWSIGRRRGLGI